MKIASFNDYRLGLVEVDRVYDVTAAVPSFLDHLPAQRTNWMIANWEAVKEAMRVCSTKAEGLRLSEVTLLPANPAPAHVFAAPANYQKHIGELGPRSTVTKKGRSAREQGFFLKAPGSLLGAGGTLYLPRGTTRRFDHESELAVIIGKPGRNIARADAYEHIFGYSCLIDATMRIEADQFEEERSMRKSFAGFTPLGPYLVTADEVADPMALSNRLSVDGQVRQDANTRDMIVGIAELIELISSVLPLAAGDVIATGTPEGVGPIVPGNRITISLEQVGVMEIQVEESPTTAPRPY